MAAAAHWCPSLSLSWGSASDPSLRTPKALWVIIDLWQPSLNILHSHWPADNNVITQVHIQTVVHARVLTLWALKDSSKSNLHCTISDVLLSVIPRKSYYPSLIFITSLNGAVKTCMLSQPTLSKQNFIKNMGRIPITKEEMYKEKLWSSLDIMRDQIFSPDTGICWVPIWPVLTRESWSSNNVLGGEQAIASD